MHRANLVQNSEFLAYPEPPRKGMNVNVPDQYWARSDCHPDAQPSPGRKRLTKLMVWIAAERLGLVENGLSHLGSAAPEDDVERR